MRRLFLRSAHGARPGSGRRAFRAAAPEGLPVSENHLTEAAPPGTAERPQRPSLPIVHPGSAAGSGRPLADKPAARRSVCRRREPSPPLHPKRGPASTDASLEEVAPLPSLHSHAQRGRTRSGLRTPFREKAALRCPKDEVRKHRASLPLSPAVRENGTLCPTPLPSALANGSALRPPRVSCPPLFAKGDARLPNLSFQR